MKRALALLLASAGTLLATHSISNLSPSQRTAGTPGFTLFIIGQGFQPTNIVRFNGQQVPSLFMSPNQLRADIPTNLIVNPQQLVPVGVLDGVEEAFRDFTINPPLQINTLSLPNGTVGAAYNQSVAVIQGTPPYTWTFTGQLPSNLNLNSSNGQISGVPNVAGTSNFTINVTDSGGGSTSRAYSITINAAAGPPVITTQSLPNGSLGVAYSGQVTATGGTGAITWSQPVGTLPNGLALNAGNGVISGTPQAVGTFNFRIRATDINSQFGEKDFTVVIGSIVVQPTSSNLPNGSVNTPYSQQFSAAGANGAVTWTTTQGAFPAGMSLNNSTGVLSGTPTAGGTFNFTIRATDATNAFGERQYSLSITGGNPPAIVTQALPGGVVGSAYTAVVEATGGTGARSWSVPPNTLPPGLLLNPVNGAITGVPAIQGTFVFTITVTDAVQATASRQFTVSIIQPQPRTITSISPAVTTAGAPAFTLTINGSNFVFSDIVLFGGQQIAATFVSSTRFTAVVPASLLTQPGIVSITLFGSVADQATSGFLINPKPTVQTTSLASGRVGTLYSQTVAVSGGTGPFRWTVLQGTIPPGLTLNDQTGVISGIPTTAGSYPITLAVNDSVQIGASQSFTIVIASPFGSLPDGRVGVAYSSRFVVAGAPAPVVCRTTSSSLPPGLALAADCLLSGTPTAEGTFSFLILTTDGSGAAGQSSASVRILPAFGITPASLTSGLPGTAFSQTFTAVASSGPVTWSIASGSLPPGLTLNASTGVISGTPTTLGEYRFTLRWSDSAGNSFSRDFTLAIGARLSFSTESQLPAVSAGANYSVTIGATGGTGPYRFAVTGGALPSGLSLDSSGGISGAARAEGSYRFTVSVTDNTQATATREFSLEVGPPLAISTGATLPAATFGRAFSIDLQATGAQPPYRWTVTAGALPGGVSVSAAGVLSGTPQATGTFRFTVEASDSNSVFRAQTSREFTLVVQPPAVSSVNVTGASDTVQPAQQPTLGVELASAYPLPLNGTLTLTFVSDAVNPADDPSVQFLPRGRTLDFTIPANATRAEFATPAMIGTGTVSGEIRIAISLASGGMPVTPVPAPRVIRVNRAAPVIRSVSVTRTATGFDVIIIGYSTPRDGIATRFRFESSGGNLTTPDVNVQSNGLFTGHFTSPQSVATGGQFQYTQSFSLTGDFSILRFVEVTLTNTVGASQPMRASF